MGARVTMGGVNVHAGQGDHYQWQHRNGAGWALSRSPWLPFSQPWDRRVTAFALGSGCEATVTLLFSIFHGPLRSWLHFPPLPASRLPCVHKGLHALHLLAGKPHSRLERGRRLRAGDPLFLALSILSLCECPGVAITKHPRLGA